MILLHSLNAFLMSKSPKLTSITSRSLRCKFSMKSINKIRPTLDDVERISKGQAAKRRGTGSRAVPHRLNAQERKEWDLAKKRCFLLLRGTGWRKERGDSPLANIYRQLCDARAEPAISVARGLGIDGIDEVCCDFSPLRTLDYEHEMSVCITEANNGNYESFIEVRHNTIEEQGWEFDPSLFETEQIWRLPVYNVVATFSDRKDSRAYAAALAQKLCNPAVIESKKDLTKATSED